MWFIYGGVVLLTFTLTYLFSFRSVITHDYGVLLDRIYRITLGEVPYRDFNLPTTPLTYLIQAVVFKIFAPSIFWMKVSLSFMNSVLVCGAIHIARKFLWINWKIYLLFVIPIAIVWSPGIILMRPWYDFDANFFALFTLFSLLTFSQSQKKSWVIIAGIACGLSILSKQNIGAGSFFSSLIFLCLLKEGLKGKLKTVGLFFLGLFLVAAIFSVALLCNRALTPAFEWIFLRASKRAGNLFVQAIHVVYRVNHNFIKYIFALYAISFFLLVKNFWRDSNLSRIKLGIVLYAFITTWFGCLAEGGNDYPQQQIYLSLLCPILFGFCVTLNSQEISRNFSSWAVGFLSIIMLGWPIYKFWDIPFRFGVIKWDINHFRLKGYYFPYADYRFVKDLLDFESHIPKEEKIFLWPDPIFFYFATDRRPLTPLSGFVITSWESPQEDNDQISQILEMENVTWAIIAQETFFDFGYLRFGMKEDWKTAVQKDIAMISRGDMSQARNYLYKNFEEVPGPVGYWTLKRK